MQSIYKSCNPSKSDDLAEDQKPMQFDPHHPDRQIYFDQRNMQHVDNISPSYHFKAQERNKNNRILTEGTDPFESEMEDRLQKLKEDSGGENPWVNVSGLLSAEQLP